MKVRLRMSRLKNPFLYLFNRRRPENLDKKEEEEENHRHWTIQRRYKSDSMLNLDSINDEYPSTSTRNVHSAQVIEINYIEDDDVASNQDGSFNRSSTSQSLKGRNGFLEHYWARRRSARGTSQYKSDNEDGFAHSLLEGNTPDVSPMPSRTVSDDEEETREWERIVRNFPARMIDRERDNNDEYLPARPLPNFELSEDDDDSGYVRFLANS